jgi:hypothetical protein
VAPGSGEQLQDRNEVQEGEAICTLQRPIEAGLGQDSGKIEHRARYRCNRDLIAHLPIHVFESPRPVEADRRVPMAAGRPGDVNRVGKRRKQVPQPCGGAMAQDCRPATRQYSGQETSVGGEQSMSHRIHAAMNLMKATRDDFPLD